MILVRGKGVQEDQSPLGSTVQLRRALNSDGVMVGTVVNCPDDSTCGTQTCLHGTERKRAGNARFPQPSIYPKLWIAAVVFRARLGQCNFAVSYFSRKKIFDCILPLEIPRIQ
jgi:hypothetical protein